MVNIKDYEAMAKLNLEEKEREIIEAQADMLLDSFVALESINTEKVNPLVSVLDMQNILREDKSAKVVTREELLSNAPEQYEGYFQVPRTLE